jgi:undecaprenyl diphosphate synthase
LADLPDPDLFIRTGGDHRVSNFLLWNIAYAELFFTDVLWPQFDETVLAEAIADFASRERRFGRTGRQRSTGADVAS